LLAGSPGVNDEQFFFRFVNRPSVLGEPKGLLDLLPAQNRLPLESVGLIVSFGCSAWSDGVRGR
jgi:hypothetical protein